MLGEGGGGERDLEKRGGRGGVRKDRGEEGKSLYTEGTRDRWEGEER